ncbi:MAG: HD domain-containing protein [Minisyncoccia bacterium]
MERIEKLREEVKRLYEEKRFSRADWADWLYEGHVVLVGNEARKIAHEYGGSPELAEAAGLLHDVADAVMKREDPNHEQESFRIARELLQKTGFSDDEIAIIVDDAIAKHSCHGDVRPASLEGKAMAAADGVVHMTSNFYEFAENGNLGHLSSQKVAKWALPKIDRDFTNKIAYEDLRERVRPEYERLKAHFTEVATAPS